MDGPKAKYDNKYTTAFIYVSGRISAIACQFEAFLICSLAYASIGFYLCLAVERYVAILHPFQYVVLCAKYNSTLWLFLPLICGFLLGSPPLVGWSQYGKMRESSTYCAFDLRSKGTSSYFIVVIVIAFIVPVALTAILFI